MSLEQLFLQLGICGAMLLVWFRIEAKRMEITARAEEQRIAADTREADQRAAAENRRSEALEEGFRTLANMFATHAQADTRAHGAMTERMAAIETHIGVIRKTPAQGVPVREVNRARTQDGNR